MQPYRKFLFLENKLLKNKINIAIIVSFLVHFLLFMFLFLLNKNQDNYKIVNVSDVEFLEQSQISKQKVDKSIFKGISNIIKKEFNTNIDNSKNSNTSLNNQVENNISKKDEKNTIVEPKLDNQTKVEVKNIDNNSAISDNKNDSIQDRKVAISLEEVGDKKASQKILDISDNENKRAKRILNDIAPIELKDKPERVKNEYNSSIKLDENTSGLKSEKLYFKTKDLDVHVSNNKPSVYMSQKFIIMDAKDEKEIHKKNIDIEKPILKQKPLLEMKDASEIKDKSIKISRTINTKISENIKHQDIEEDLSKYKKVFEIHGELKNRKILSHRMPDYPDWAQNKGIEAFVNVYFEVSSDGKIIDESIRIDVTSGYKKLDDLVIDNLKFWKFAKIDGDYIQGGIITFNFRLT